MLTEEIYLKDARFWSRVKITDHCWEWTGATVNGYGVLARRKLVPNLIKAHRYVMYLFGRLANIKDKLYVLHKCDNPICVNPNHLFLGTHLDNMRDMQNKGRDNYIIPSPQIGEDNASAKLNWVIVRQIREEAKQIKKWGRLTILSKKYRVSISAISKIINNKTWCE